MKRKLLFAAMFIAGALGQLRAQTDVTSTYITNPGFEGEYPIKTTYSEGTNDERHIFEPNGWTVVHTNPNTNDMTCLKSGDAQSNSFSGFTMNHSGDQTFWVRLRWGGQTWKSTGTEGSPTSIELQQAITLPNGVYRLSADVIAYYAGTEANNHTYLKASSTNNAWSAEACAANHTKSDDKWETKSFLITSSGNTEYTIGLQCLQNWNNNGETISAFDDVKLEKYSVDENNTLDITSVVSKGTGSWTNNGATNAGTFSNGGVDMVERYYKQHYTGTVSQLEVKDLPLGVYDAEVYCQAHCADWECSAIAEAAGQTDRTILSGNTVEVGIPIVNDKSLTEGPQVRTLSNIKVTDGTLTFTVRNDKQGANWLTFEIKSLTYKGVDLSEVKASYNTAKTAAEAARDNNDYSTITGAERTALVNAINASVTEDADAYIAATNALTDATAAFSAETVANYALLATEKTKAANLGMTNETIAEATPLTKTGLLALQDLKVAEYNYVTTNYRYSVNLSDTWNSTGTNTSAANFSNEHWSGTTHNYKNQNDSNGQGWNANSWSINFNQDVLLPAGKYVFKVAGRQATDEHVTTSLVVKNTSDDSELGSVNDFPRSNSSRGINKSGATSFNEDASAYANGGKGYGWEWRYVKFELAAETTVNIAVDVQATAPHCWASFGDYTLQTDDPDVEAKLAYNVAIAAANAAYAERTSTYANVTGSELTALADAIALDPETEGYADVTTALNNATNAFTSAKDSYDAYALAKSYADAITAVALPYATSEKIEAVATAKNVTVNTAADAATQAGTINAANRAAYESNAIAENVPGKARTNLITNADGSNVVGWSGEFWTASNESFTDAAGSSTNTYFDKNGVKSFTTSQTIKLQKGTYILSVTARAQADINSYKMQVKNNAGETEEVALTAIGNENGVFNRGWNDFFVVFEQKAFGDATISIIGDNTTNNKDFWMSWDRFRLYSIGETEGNFEIAETDETAPAAMEDANVTLIRTLSRDYWNTFTSPVNITAAEITNIFGEGSQVREMDTERAVADNVIPFKDATSIVAGVPYLVKPAQTVENPSFTGKTVVAEGETIANGDYKYIGILAKTQLNAPGDGATALDLYLSTSNTMKKPGSSGANLKGMRAYFNVPVSAEGNVKLFLGEDTDAIEIIDGEPVAGAEIFNLAGQRVNKAQRGIYIINGKKVVVK